MLSCRSLRASDLPVVQKLLHKPFDTIFLNSQNTVPWMPPIRIVIRIDVKSTKRTEVKPFLY